MINLKCDSPVRIRNKYTGDYMMVNCRKCMSCKINQVNTKCVHLMEDMKRFPFHMFVTLTYSNDNLPYMTIDSYDVYRGIPSRTFPKKIARYEDMDLSKFKVYRPRGFPDGAFTGVLFIDDIQKFFKRLRIYYERKYNCRFPYRYHYLCEYGTSGKRPHFHVLFYGFKEFTDSFRDAVIENWQLCSWDKLELAQCFKYASDGISSYLTSYVNSLFGDDDFFQQKRIKSRVRRSKDINFGFDEKLKKAFYEAVQRGFSGTDCKSVRECFSRIDTSKLGVFSSVLVPNKIVSSLFATPREVRGLTYYDFGFKCRSGIERYFKSKRGEEIDNNDYRLYLSYKRYCTVRCLPFNESSLQDWILDNWNVNNFYKALVLKHYMLDSNSGIGNYKEYAYNTKIEDLDKRDYWLACNNILYVDGVNSSDSFKELQNYRNNYKYKLLPKHLHGLITNGYYI